METQAVLRGVRISAQKGRLVADQVRGKPVEAALNILTFSPKKAAKIVKSLENEAEVASAREASLRGSLNEVKTQASGLSEAEIKLRALEREAKAQRDLLESYLGRYRDASARHDMGAVPAQAAIVSRAHASILPSFPQRGPISLLVTVSTALLALTYVLARELIGAPAAAPRRTQARGFFRAASARASRPLRRTPGSWRLRHR